MKALCTEQLEPKSKHNLAVFLAEQGCHWSWASQEKSLLLTKVWDSGSRVEGSQNCNLQDFQEEYFEPYPSATAGIQKLPPLFLSFKYFFPITLIKATTFSAGIVRTCQVSPDAQISWLSSPYGNSQVPQLSEARIWTWDSSFHEGISVILADLVPNTATVNHVTGYESSSVYSFCMISLFVPSHPPFLYSIAALHWFNTIDKRAWRQRQLSDWNSWFSWWHHVPKRGKESQEKRLLILNSKQLQTGEESTTLLTEKKAAVGFWIYFTLLDRSCLKILWGSRAQRKPCFKAYHCTQGAYENFINMNPCYPVQSPPADLLTQPVPQWPHSTTTPCFHQALE